MRKLSTLSLGLVAMLAVACSSSGGSASPAAPGSVRGGIERGLECGIRRPVRVGPPPPARRTA